MPILILFLLLPLVEIWLFVKVGELIGAWQTAGLVLAMAIVGAILVRVQGFAVLQRARATLAAGEFPTRDLLDGLFVLIAGFLMILPGFFSDFLGILLFIPPVRRWLGASIWDWVSHRPDIVIHRYGASGSGPSGSSRVVEGTYHEVRPEDDQASRDPGRDPALGPPTNPRP